MKIYFLDRELRNETVEVNHITYCYLLAIRNKYPSVWKQIKELIKRIDDEGGK